MEDLFGVIIYLGAFGFVGFAVYFCNKVAKKTGMSQAVAILAGLLFAIPALLIYSHLNYQADKKVKENKVA